MSDPRVLVLLDRWPSGPVNAVVPAAADPDRSRARRRQVRRRVGDLLIAAGARLLQGPDPTVPGGLPARAVGEPPS